MSKIAIFSDLHAHTFSNYATILPNGMNSRLADAVSCIDQVHDYCTTHDVDLVLFGGDMFHTRRQVPTQALNAVYTSISRFAASKVPVFMIDGNHDQADREGKFHSLYTFQTFLEIADGPGWYSVAGKSGLYYSVMAVPYTENLQHLRAVVQEPCPGNGGPKIFLGHLGVQGAKVGADFVYKNPHDPGAGDLNADAFDAGFLGHYHIYQTVPGARNFYYIGAPLQHNWGDRGQDRGFLVYDTNTKTHERVLLTAPKFVEMEEGRFSKKYHNDDFGAFQGNYVRVIDNTNANWSEDERAEYHQDIGARSLEAVQVPLGDTANTQRIDLPSELSYEDIVSNYVTSGRTNTDELDDDYLISMGKEIMKEAEAQE